MSIEIKQGAGPPLVFRAVDEFGAPLTGLTPAVLLSKNGQAFAAAAGTVSEVGRGIYALTPDAADTNTLGQLVLAADAPGATVAEMLYQVVSHTRQELMTLLQAADQVLLAELYTPVPEPQITIPAPATDAAMCVVYLDAENLSNQPAEGVVVTFRLMAGPSRTERALTSEPMTMELGADGRGTIELQRNDLITPAGSVYRVSCRPIFGSREPEVILTTETFNLQNLIT